MSKVYIADRDVEGLAKVSYSQSAKYYKRKPVAWRAPWPPRPEPKAATKPEAETDDLLLRATIAAAMRKNGTCAMIAVTATTLGETIADGIVWRVQRTPAGNWRICHREDIKRGVTFTWKDEWFKRLIRGIESPEEVDAECERLLQRCSVAVQAVMRER